MTATIQTVESVEAYGENLSIVTTSGGNKVIANKQGDGTFRWAEGEPVVYVSEGSVIPEDVLKERGYWDAEKDRGLLDGGPRNRVKMKKLAGFESRGLLFKVSTSEVWGTASNGEDTGMHLTRGHDLHFVHQGEDVSEFFDITEFKA